MNRNFSLRALTGLLLFVLMAGCAFAQTTTPKPKTTPKKTTTKKKTMSQKIATTTTTVTPTADNPKGYKPTDLVSLTEIDPTIVVDSPLARADNAFHYQFFKDPHVAYVRYATAKKIAAVQKALAKDGLRLKIWAAYRPFPVQIKMYDLVGRDGNKVSDPYDPSSKKAHVRGVAIDCTLVDKDGKELEMPTGYCDFENNYKKMWLNYMDLPKQVIKNRTLLHEVMIDHEMSGYSKEWWHFQDNKIDTFPAITMQEFPEIHKQILVDEMLNAKPEPKPKPKPKSE